MDAEPEIPLTRVAAFIRQHTHDVRNGLNSLDLESALLQELVTDEEGRETVGRLRKQLRSVAEHMRTLSARFQDLQPVATPIAARELLTIWREKQATLTNAPEVRWMENLDGEKVAVDVEMMAAVFGELLSNAAAFSPGQPVTVTARAQGSKVILELCEPRAEMQDTSTWGEAFSTTRRGGYGLGLWAAKRLVKANGATMIQRCAPEEGGLTTQIVLAVL